MPTYYIPKEQFKIISKEEILPFIENAQDPEIKFLIILAWLTGARISELIKLEKENFLIDKEKDELVIVIKAEKGGKIGYPTFSISQDPFVSLVVEWVENKTGRLFQRGRRRYQQMLNELNRKIYGLDKSKWITFHYLRHSRITYLARVLRAYPEEIQSWTGHKSSAFEEYIAPRKVERFKGKIQ